VPNEIIETIRSDYDRLAREYARHVSGELDHKPIDRQFLDRFAEQVRGKGKVCDLGCGPGHVARYLHQQGVAVFGLDLSPGMVNEARVLNPDIQFSEANMLALDLHDEALGGLVAFYAIVNLPGASLPLAFAEMARVLKPNGHLLLSFHVGDETIPVSELWGVEISMEFRLLNPKLIADYLTEAGLIVEELIERPPYAPEVEYQSRRAYVFARKTPSKHIRGIALTEPEDSGSVFRSL